MFLIVKSACLADILSFSSEKEPHAIQALSPCPRKQASASLKQGVVRQGLAPLIRSVSHGRSASSTATEGLPHIVASYVPYVVACSMFTLDA